MRFLTYLSGCALALLLHEAAHIGMALLWGVEVRRIGFSLKGFFIVRAKGEPLANVAISLAGPTMNLVLALMFESSAPEFALVNLTIGICNLLPIAGSDGRRALQVLQAAHNKVWHPEDSEDDPKE
jgi:Zn-dependent protease